MAGETDISKTFKLMREWERERDRYGRKTDGFVI